MTTIAVDLDEVLSDTLPAFIAFHNKHYGTQLSSKDFYTYHFEDVLHIPTDQIVTRLLEFYLDNSHTIEPVAGAQQTLHALKETCSFVIVTARLNAIESVTREWVEREFPGIFKAIHFAHNVHVGCDRKAKHAFCTELGASVMIDDSIEYLRPCAENGVRGVLFDRAWNRNQTLVGIERVESWADVQRLLQSS